MEQTFIYVFKEDDCKRLQDCGYKLLHKHQTQDIWVFVVEGTMKFDRNDVEAVVSNILTF